MIYNCRNCQNWLENDKTHFENAKTRLKNAKTRFKKAKTRFEKAKTRFSGILLQWTPPEWRSKNKPANALNPGRATLVFI